MSTGDDSSSSSLRRGLSRLCKDTAIARIHVPFENTASPPKLKIKRSQSVRVKTISKEADEFDSDYNDNDDSSSNSDNSYESISSSVESIELPAPKTPNIKRTKTISRTRKSMSVPTRKTRYVEDPILELETDKLPCRENEYEMIWDFVYEKIRCGIGGCLFISGIPGTGKTATVMRVLNMLQMQQNSLDITEFDRIELNGMEISDSKQIYKEIVTKLTKHKYASFNKNREILKGMFFGTYSKKKQNCCVLVIDEIDELCRRSGKQDVVYELFDMAGQINNKGNRSKLIILAIANTMDLPERYLQNKVSSRVGLGRITFKPYSADQLEEIIRVKLGTKNLNKFDNQAITFAAKKVSASSGDARRVIDICSRALELHIDNKKHITTMEVDQIIKDMFTSPFLFAIQNRCSVIEKLTLRALVAAFKSGGVEEANFQQLQDKFSEICRAEGYSMIKSDLLTRVVLGLEEQGLLVYDSLKKDLNMGLKLRVRPADVQFALDSVN